MTFNQSHTIASIAQMIGANIVGNPQLLVTGSNLIHRVAEGQMVFVAHPKYYQMAIDSKASVILLNQIIDCPPHKALLISEDPFGDFNKINLQLANGQPAGQDNQIGPETYIHPSATIGQGVQIGRGCSIGPNVVINDHTIIGNFVQIQAGTIIGSEAFYYRKAPYGFEKLQSVGHVIIEDYVEIGANCTIDRGIADSTIISKSTKMDNQIQIGHDTIIGERCLIASQVGISGSCFIGNDVTIWGQVGVASAIKIGDKAIILAKSGVSKDLKGGKTYFGLPAEEATGFYKKTVRINNLVKK
jgi:UDP-3-O-[3-hydroxymyristoyl] glucosamine N-acyltransferase